ncbi:DUF2599 domain-containing protein [Paenibacillus alba]|nr:DUF2599 domain-containing protein [Paenibacillus alba]
MQWQFDCHYYFALIKETWNLEPSSSSTSYLNCVKNKCQ